MNTLRAVEAKQMRDDRDNFKIGDTVKVYYKIVEGNRERIQVYEGIVIAMDNKGIRKTFTVRRISFDIEVERIFPFYSPRIAKIEVIRKGKIRRAKLYYLRERKGKSAKLRERRIQALSYNDDSISESITEDIEQPADQESNTEESSD